MNTQERDALVEAIKREVAESECCAVAFERPTNAAQVAKRLTLRPTFPRFCCITRTLEDGRVVLIVMSRSYEQQWLESLLERGLDVERLAVFYGTGVRP